MLVNFRISKLTILLAMFSLLLWAYAIFSFSLTDPNLVLFSNQNYWQFQQWAWQKFFHNPKLLTSTYFLILSGLSIFYVLIALSLPKIKVNFRWVMVYLIVAILPLMFSYNALSHDVFNYIFNGRMVINYQANPHTQVALEFAQIDDWTRFMHNTHTTAPYGYGWTALSLLPVWLGFGKFFITWTMFKLFSIMSIFLTGWALWHLSQSLKQKALSVYQFGWLILNPLFLIEVVSNMHNDLWMMALAIFAMSWLIRALKLSGIQKWGGILLAICLWVLSVQIKFASLALIPLGVIIIFGQLKIDWWIKKLSTKLSLFQRPTHTILENIYTKLQSYLPFMASVLMFLPLTISRSQQFLPWYLLWSLVWLPLIKVKGWKKVLLIFSFSSMLRYLPWMYHGQYTDDVIYQQKLITWGLALVLILLLSGLNLEGKKSTQLRAIKI